MANPKWKGVYPALLTPFKKDDTIDAEKVDPVEKEFDGKKVQRFQYTVKDPNTSQEKYWTVSKRTSEQIDAFLSEGHDLLKIQRFGSGKDTRYQIIPS